MASPITKRSETQPFAGVFAIAVGAAAIGAVAIGAFAVGRLAVGRLAIGRARIGRLEVEDLRVRKLNDRRENRADGLTLLVAAVRGRRHVGRRNDVQFAQFIRRKDEQPILRRLHRVHPHF